MMMMIEIQELLSDQDFHDCLGYLHGIVYRDQQVFLFLRPSLRLQIPKSQLQDLFQDQGNGRD